VSTVKRDAKPGQKPEARRVVLGDRSHRNLANALLLEEAVAPRHIRLTIALLCVTIAAFVAWSTVARLDEVANAPGQIVPSGAIQVVQHQDGGTIARISVAEGARVEKGQVLIALDPVETQAELNVSEARHWALVARVARLRAQASERWDAADFSEVPAAHADLVRDQRAILDSHRQAIENQEKVIRAQIAQLEADLGRVKEQISTGQREVGILREVAGIRDELEKDRLVTKVQSLETQRTLVVQEGDLQRNRAQSNATRAAVGEARARLVTLRSDRRQAANDEIGTATAELSQVTELLVKLRKRLTRIEVTAPVRGLVQDLRYRTIGGVIPPGAMVMNIVPVDDVLNAEVRISTSDIGHVRPGQRVRLKVLTYDFLRYGTIDGDLESVSAASFLDEKGNPYFKGIVKLSRAHLGNQPDLFPVLPGMTVIGDIVTDRKTVFQYLARPLVVAFRQGLRER
jgi:adhesin transport system membrane fusion protein